MTAGSPSRRILAVDANNLIHRSWHGFRRAGAEPRALSTAGVPTEAVQGMISITARRARQIRATHLIVAFDPPGGCPQRKELIPAYKGNRSEAPGDLVGQLELSFRLLQRAGVAVCRPEGWEADDVLATVAATADERSAVWLLTADRDAVQAVREGVTILLPDGGVELGEKEVEERYGVNARSYPHMAALRGEPGDGISGVPGVGKVGAQRLIRHFGTVEATLAADEGSLVAAAGRRTANAIISSGGAAIAALEAGRLRTDLDVPSPTELAQLDTELVERVMTQAGMRTAGSMLLSLKNL